MSRALGDAPYRDSGLIAEPELAPWRVLEAADALLLLASDGLFETLPADEACRIALAVATGALMRAVFVPLYTCCMRHCSCARIAHVNAM